MTLTAEDQRILIDAWRYRVRNGTFGQYDRDVDATLAHVTSEDLEPYRPQLIDFLRGDGDIADGVIAHPTTYNLTIPEFFTRLEDGDAAAVPSGDSVNPRISAFAEHYRLLPDGDPSHSQNDDTGITRTFIDMPEDARDAWQDLYEGAILAGRGTVNLAGVPWIADGSGYHHGARNSTFGFSTANFFRWTRRLGVTVSDRGTPITVPTPSTDTTPEVTISTPVFDPDITVEALSARLDESPSPLAPVAALFHEFTSSRGWGRQWQNWMLQEAPGDFGGRTERTWHSPYLSGFLEWLRLEPNRSRIPVTGAVPSGDTVAFDVEMTAGALEADRYALLARVPRAAIDAYIDHAAANGTLRGWLVNHFLDPHHEEAQWNHLAAHVRHDHSSRFLTWAREHRDLFTLTPQEVTVTTLPAFTRDEWAAMPLPQRERYTQDLRAFRPLSRTSFYSDEDIDIITRATGDFWATGDRYVAQFIDAVDSGRYVITGTVEPEPTPAPEVTTDSAEPGRIIPIGPEHPDWQQFAERLAEVATRNSMCPEYDRIARNVGLPTRKHRVTYRVTIDVPVDVERDHNADARALKEAARARLESMDLRPRQLEQSRTITVA